MAVTVEERIMKLTLENAQAITSARKYQQAMMGVADSTKEAARGAARMKGATNGLMSGFGRRGIGGAVQQAGYQVADFAIVLQQGQGAMRAFAVQGGQLISAFGPWGAAVGGVVTVAGLAIQAWLDMEGEAKSLTDALSDLTDAQEVVSNFQLTEANTEGLDATIGKYKELLSLVLEVATARQDAQTEELVRSIGLLDALKDYETQLSLISQIGGNTEDFDFLGLENTQQATFALVQFNQLLGKTREEQLALLPSIQEALLLRGALTEEMKNTIADMAIALGLQDEITSAAEDHTKAVNDTKDVYDLLVGYVEDVKDAIFETSRSHEVMNIKAAAFVGYTKVSAFFMGQIAKFSAIAARDAERQAEAERIATQQYKERFAGEEEVFGQPVRQDNISQQDALESWRKLTEEKEKSASATKRLSEAEKQYAADLKAHESLLEDMKVSYQDLAESGVGGFVDMLFDAETSFADFARTFLIQIGKMIAQQLLLNAITKAFGGKGGASLTPPVLGGAGVTAFAKGGVINTPTIFPMGNNQTGIAGEAGAEAIMPLKRGTNGELGVAGPQITINNNAGAEISVTRSDDEVIEIAVNRATKQTQAEFARSMQTGQGAFARSMEQGYTARRRAT